MAVFDKRRKHGPQLRRQLPTRALVLAGLSATLLCLFYFSYHLPRQQTDVLQHGGGIWESQSARSMLAEPPTPYFCGRPPLICAHGGDPQAAPPNSMRSFKVASQALYGCIEVDVALTADEALVVLHQRDLRHLLQLSGNTRQANPQVGDFTVEELLSLQWEDGDGVELFPREF